VRTIIVVNLSLRNTDLKVVREDSERFSSASITWSFHANLFIVLNVKTNNYEAVDQSYGGDLGFRETRSSRERARSNSDATSSTATASATRAATTRLLRANAGRHLILSPGKLREDDRAGALAMTGSNI
jgi:hypothetical protein